LVFLVFDDAFFPPEQLVDPLLFHFHK
jgi:hypothetical protein